MVLQVSAVRLVVSADKVGIFLCHICHFESFNGDTANTQTICQHSLLFCSSKTWCCTFCQPACQTLLLARPPGSVNAHWEILQNKHTQPHSELTVTLSLLMHLSCEGSALFQLSGLQPPTADWLLTGPK